MKIPSVIRTYCPYCRRHSEHKVKIVSKGKMRKLSWGARKGERHKRGAGGHGRYSKPPISTLKVKVSTRHDVLLTCQVCKKSHHRGYPRAKKFEVV